MKNLFYLFFFVFAFQLQAQIINVESLRIKTDTLGWAGKIGLNFSMIQNTKSLVNIGNDTHVQYKTSKSLILLIGQYSLLVSENNNLINKSVLHLRYNYNFTGIIVGEWFLQGQRNAISKIDFRGLLGAGLRLKLKKDEKHKYYFGTTFMYEYEISTSQLTQELFRWSNYFSLSLYPTENVRFISTTYYQPAFSGFSDYRILSQNSLYFIISEHMRFKTSFNYSYDNCPEINVPKTQYSLLSGLVFDL
jgi:putative salt-induced outer membrane protein YdiY